MTTVSRRQHALWALAGESGDTLIQGKMFGYMSLAWGLGTVVGPLIGGSLARPCDRFGSFPMCAEGNVFSSRPFFLPCLVGSITVLGSAIATLVRATSPTAGTSMGWHVHAGQCAAGFGGFVEATALHVPHHAGLPSASGCRSNLCLAFH